MILSYLYSLGISVIFTANINNYCGDVSETGCFIYDYSTGVKQIVVSVESPNFKQTFWHEVGHALLNDYSYELDNLCVSDYPDRTGTKYMLDEFQASLFYDYYFRPERLKKYYSKIYKYLKTNNIPQF